MNKKKIECIDKKNVFPRHISNFRKKEGNNPKKNTVKFKDEKKNVFKKLHHRKILNSLNRKLVFLFNRFQENRSINKFLPPQLSAQSKNSNPQFLSHQLLRT